MVRRTPRGGRRGIRMRRRSFTSQSDGDAPVVDAGGGGGSNRTISQGGDRTTSQLDTRTIS